MILDLHTHTRKSYDGFTSPAELLAACIVRGVDAVAVTEHDFPCDLDPLPFAESGIELIPGCEFTDANGAHIIGLFVRKGLSQRLCSEAILDHIRTEGGLAVMPHPWKPGSGFMAMGGNISLVRQFDFIEFVNGGWPSGDHHTEIVSLAYDHDLRMISSSDSHKASQVGLCCTRIKSATNSGARDALVNVRQEDIEMLIDQSMLKVHGRLSGVIQRSSSYQSLLPFIPKLLRRTVKIALYAQGPDRYARIPHFESVELGCSK
jgi:predicted metal-dependent phosphoesterase TrpH